VSLRGLKHAVFVAALLSTSADADVARAQPPWASELYAEPVKGAGASDLQQNKPILYTGAALGLALHGGPTVMNDDSLSSRVGFVAGVAGRMTGLLQLSDGELGYHLSRTSPSGRAGEVGVMRHGFSFTAGFHPLFLLGLGNRWIHYVINSVHADIGGSYHLTTLSFGGDTRTRGDIGWQWGGGLDLPLQNPNKGTSWWLGLRYRQVRVNTDLATERILNVGQHQLLVSLEHRWNWK